MTEQSPHAGTNFIIHIIDEDLKSGKHKKVITRFPPEPNGYLHIGHAKSICLNFGIAEKYNGQCHLRFDDTNPEKEEVEYKDAIKEDIRWLGFDWGKHFYHASDYFDQLYEYAIDLIKKGRAYVCDLSADDVRKYRGTLTESGKISPYRNRSIEENLDLFESMRKGEFNDGEKTLRAKIDMSSGNINMRDPAIYRIRKVSHHNTGDKWCIYPMYDYTHCISDALENITHSLCTLEFEDHRPLYDWVLNELQTPCHPQQIEFARLELNYTITSKRKLKELVDGGYVKGWDDPRLPTLKGLRRRGFTPTSIRNFCERVGISKKKTIIDMSILEECVRDHLNEVALRAMAVLDPIKVVIETYPEDKVEYIVAKNHPLNNNLGTRKLPFSRVIYIERDDFMENPPKDFFRLTPGKEVRLRYAYLIKCNQVIKDKQGNIVELRCNHDPDTLGKNPADNRKVKGVIHWVSEKYSLPAIVNIYDRLFIKEDPTADEKDGIDFTGSLNPNSLKVMEHARIEPSLQGAKLESSYQFERLGYFCVDKDSGKETLIFNRVVTLKDAWAKTSK